MLPQLYPSCLKSWDHKSDQYGEIKRSEIENNELIQLTQTILGDVDAISSFAAASKNPSWLLESEAFKALVAKLRADYAVVSRKRLEREIPG